MRREAVDLDGLGGARDGEVWFYGDSHRVAPCGCVSRLCVTNLCHEMVPYFL
jgi:hypothetical protein